MKSTKFECKQSECAVKVIPHHNPNSLQIGVCTNDTIHGGLPYMTVEQALELASVIQKAVEHALGGR